MEKPKRDPRRTRSYYRILWITIIVGPIALGLLAYGLAVEVRRGGQIGTGAVVLGSLVIVAIVWNAWELRRAARKHRDDG
jgi:uncharacterized membrane protein YdjX (TVP38/TMEM64 family)